MEGGGALNSTENDIGWSELHIRIIEHIGNFLIQLEKRKEQASFY